MGAPKRAQRVCKSLVRVHVRVASSYKNGPRHHQNTRGESGFVPTPFGFPNRFWDTASRPAQETMRALSLTVVLTLTPHATSQSPGYPSSGSASYCSSWCAGAIGDPHISFANGGSADFRGSHRGSYVFLSSPGYQFAPYFQEVDFMYKSVVGLRQLVHGTFMTQAGWHIRTAAGREILVKADAMTPGEAHVAVLKSTRAHVAPETALAGSEETSLMPWAEATFDDVRVSTRFLTVLVETAAWTVEVTAKPIYGLVPPLLNNTHIHGRWEEDQKRFDISVRGAFPSPEAHGIVGQSFRDAVRRDGAVDNYDIEDAPEKANADGYLPPMTTSAQAEGAIDGVYTDYQLDHALSTAFAFSRYDRVSGLPRVTASHRTASTSEWDGVAGSESTKRQRTTEGSQIVAQPDEPGQGQTEEEGHGRTLSECVCEANVQLVHGARQWSDGTFAQGCWEYITPPSGYTYSGATGDGAYTVQPSGSGSSFDVYCDMTLDGGGWTLVDNDATDSDMFSSRQAGANDDVSVTRGSLLPSYTWSSEPQLLCKASLYNGDLPWLTFDVEGDGLTYPTSTSVSGGFSAGTLNGNTNTGMSSYIRPTSGDFGSVWIGGSSTHTCACNYYICTTTSNCYSGLGSQYGAGSGSSSTCSTWVR